MAFENNSASYDLVCLSHLRWDFVYQRPQHLISRFAPQHRVFFVEEPVFDSDTPYLDVTPRGDNLKVLVAHLPWGPTEHEHGVMYRALFDAFLAENGVKDYVLWYYTPMMVAWTDTLTPKAVVFDVMDELSAFAGAHPELLGREQRLLDKADLVFTGGQSLYDGKKDRHPHVYFFASSVDIAHFSRARKASGDEPADQKDIPHPRLGFFGVLDERIDWDLLGAVADLKPGWQWVIAGPRSGKIGEELLPKRPNIHYLGGKDYADLPRYLAGWGRRDYAVCDQRRDPLHLADQDPRVPRGRQAGRLDPDPRCRPAVRRRRPRPYRRDPGRVRRRLRRRAARGPRRTSGAGGPGPGRDVVGYDLDQDA